MSHPATEVTLERAVAAAADVPDETPKHGKQDHAVRSAALRPQCDALTIEFADGAELLTVGVVATEADRVILSIDSTQAPNVRIAKDAVVTTTDRGDDATRYVCSLVRSLSASAI